MMEGAVAILCHFKSPVSNNNNKNQSINKERKYGPYRGKKKTGQLDLVLEEAQILNLTDKDFK